MTSEKFPLRRRPCLARIAGIVGAVGLGVGSISGTATASTVITQEDVEDPPLVITESGDYEVGEDLDADETLIRIKAGDVDIDGNEHHLDSGYGADTIEINNASNVTVENVSIAGKAGISLTDVAECTVQDASIRALDSIAVRCRNVTESTLENITTRGDSGAWGLGLLDSNSNSLIDNKITPSGNGIVLRNSHDNTLIDNVARSSSNEEGIRLWDSNGNKLKNNQANRNNQSGIVISGVNNEVIENTAYSNIGSGIVVLDSNNMVRHNNVEWNDRGGIRVSGSKNSVMYNELRMSDNNIEISGEENQVSQNIVNFPESPGIHLTEESNRNRVIRNEVNMEEDDDTEAIKDEGDDNQLRANVIS